MCTAASFLCTCQRDGAHVCYYSVARQLLYGCWLGKCALVFICFPLLLSCTAKAIATPAATIANFRRTRQWNTCFSMHPVCVCVCLCRYSAVPPPNLISALRPFDSFCSRNIYFWGCGFGGGPVGGISSLFTQGQKIKIIQIPIRETAMSPGYVHPCHRLR